MRNLSKPLIVQGFSLVLNENHHCNNGALTKKNIAINLFHKKRDTIRHPFLLYLNSRIKPNQNDQGSDTFKVLLNPIQLNLELFH